MVATWLRRWRKFTHPVVSILIFAVLLSPLEKGGWNGSLQWVVREKKRKETHCIISIMVHRGGIDVIWKRCFKAEEKTVFFHCLATGKAILCHLFFMCLMYTTHTYVKVTQRERERINGKMILIELHQCTMCSENVRVHTLNCKRVFPPSAHKRWLAQILMHATT